MQAIVMLPFCVSGCALCGWLSTAQVQNVSY